MYINIYVCVEIHIYICIFIHICMYVCIYTHVYIHIYIYNVLRLAYLLIVLHEIRFQGHGSRLFWARDPHLPLDP